MCREWSLFAHSRRLVQTACKTEQQQSPISQVLATWFRRPGPAPEGDGLADVLAGSECIQDEAGDVGSRNRRKDGARAAPCDLAAGCLQPSSSGSDGRWCSRGRSHGPLALARPCRRMPLGGAGRRARARVIRRRLGCPRHRTSSGRSGGERLRPSGPQSGFACLEKRRGGPAGSG